MKMDKKIAGISRNREGLFGAIREKMSLIDAKGLNLAKKVDLLTLLMA